MIAEEWARGGERRAKREALAKLIPPKLVEVWKEEGGRFLDLKSPRKLVSSCSPSVAFGFLVPRRMSPGALRLELTFSLSISVSSFPAAIP